jgi:outer membrane lipoprotein carrier protein
MSSPMKKTIVSIALSALACAAHAGGIESLENFVKSAKSGRAEFTQVVTSPAKDGQVRTKTSTGTFEFTRPNRFRFVYTKPFQQTIVADGKTLWMHDVELNQVTSRSQEKVLGSTPAALIAASPDLGALKKDYDLQSLPDREGMHWVQATPKVKEGQLNNVKIGFRGNELASLDITDGFGQRSLITFSKMELNAEIPAATYAFKPPVNADLVKQ